MRFALQDSDLANNWNSIYFFLNFYCKFKSDDASTDCGVSSVDTDYMQFLTVNQSLSQLFSGNGLHDPL